MAIRTGLALIHQEESDSSSSEQHQKVGPQHAGRREAMQVYRGHKTRILQSGRPADLLVEIFSRISQTADRSGEVLPLLFIWSGTGLTSLYDTSV
jgi:hypothetical protein